MALQGLTQEVRAQGGAAGMLLFRSPCSPVVLSPSLTPWRVISIGRWPGSDVQWHSLGCTPGHLTPQEVLVLCPQRSSELLLLSQH